MSKPNRTTFLAAVGLATFLLSSGALASESAGPPKPGRKCSASAADLDGAGAGSLVIAAGLAGLALARKRRR